MEGIAAQVDALGWGDAALLEPLCMELDLLYAMPQMKPPTPGTKILFDSDNNLPIGKRKGQNRGVRATLWCCGQKVVRCNEKLGDAACPTWVEAVQHLRRLVEAKHSEACCLERAAERRSAAGQPAEGAAPPNAFTALMAGQLAQQRAKAAVKKVEQRLEMISKQERELFEERQQLAHELRGHVSNMDVLEVTAKKRRIDGSVLLSARAEGSSAPTSTQAEPYWSAWSLEVWRRLEAIRDEARAQTLTDCLPKERMRRGLAGPLLHERRGLVGAVQEWAGGSRVRAAELLIKLIEHFEVQVRMMLHSSCVAPCLHAAY